jgi:hypothetical protein
MERDWVLTFKFAAQEDVDAPKHLNSLGYCRRALAHESPVTTDAANAVLPSFSIFP